MGFPEAIARAQRDGIWETLRRTTADLDEIIRGLREASPHNFALSRGEYERMIEYLVGARVSIALAIDQIDESLARLAREHDQDELARAEEELNRKGE